MTALAPQVLFRETPKQSVFSQAALSGTYRYLTYGGAIRGGKTWLILAMFLLFCRIWPRSRWAIVRRDLPTLRRNVVPTMEKLRPTNFCGPLHKSEFTYTCTNGSQILLFPESADIDPELERFRGLEVNGFGNDEATELKERTYYKEIERAGAWIIPGLAQEDQPPPYILNTCNPSPGWVKRLFYDPFARGILEPPMFFLQATAEDNPFIPAIVRESWKSMPAREYNRFVLGSWEDMAGLALAELDPKRHLVDPFRVPGHWELFGGFDWGYAHPWVFGVFAVDEDGVVHLVETIRGRRQRDDQIIERIKDGLTAIGLTPDRLRYIVAGHDCWSQHKARADDNTPSTAERFAEAGLMLQQASIARIAGLRNFREYVAWMPAVEGGEERDPMFRLFRTTQNLRLFDALTEVQEDPDNREDALKTDADPETGLGGDDEYDMVRYALASRPAVAKTGYLVDAPGAWSPQVLAYEAERLRKGLPAAPVAKVKGPRDAMAEAGY
jgi:6,7-dimethyl-8-ribityllumazine synthase